MFVAAGYFITSWSLGLQFRYVSQHWRCYW